MQVTDLTAFLEDRQFLAAFCGGCRAKPKAPWEDCPADGDPKDRDCVRRRHFLDIEEKLKEVAQENAIIMKSAGCLVN